MNTAEAAKLAASVLTAYRHLRSVSSMTVDERGALMDLYAAVFADLDYTEANAALLRHIRTSEYFPTPAEIGRIVDQARHGRARTGAAAWEDVRRAIGAIGGNREPHFADPVTAAVVRGLGWRELCQSTNATADRARFIEDYDQRAAHFAEDRSVAGLPGVARPALHPVDQLHALRDGQRAALAPANEGTWPVDRRTPRDDNAPVRVGEVLRLASGGRR